jgi:hypothetical protein
MDKQKEINKVIAETTFDIKDAVLVIPNEGIPYVKHKDKLTKYEQNYDSIDLIRKQ